MTFRSHIDGSTLLQDLMFFNTSNKTSRTLQQNAAVRQLEELYDPWRSTPTLTHHGINQIFSRWNNYSNTRYFPASCASPSDPDQALWAFRPFPITSDPEVTHGPAYGLWPVCRSQVYLQVTQYRIRPDPAWQSHIMLPGSYLNMRFADECCDVFLVAEIITWCGGRRGKSRTIEGKLKHEATFGELLQWLDMWDAGWSEQSDVVQVT